MAKSKKDGKNAWGLVLVGVVVLGVAVWLGLLKPRGRPQVKATEAGAFPGTVEIEPNDTYDQAKANGYISLVNGTTYTGAYDSGTSSSIDKFYIWNSAAGTTRRFTLETPSAVGTQFVLWYIPPGWPGVPAELVGIDNDDTAPTEIQATMTDVGDYEILTSKSSGNTDAWSFTIADPNAVAACPWSSPAPISNLPGTGSIQTAGNYVSGDKLYQSFWRGDQGWYRWVPIVGGTVDWNNAQAWNGPLPLSIWPGSGTIQTQSEYVLGNTLYQGLWRGDQGYNRSVPIVNGVPQFSCTPPLPTPTPTPILPTPTPNWHLSNGTACTTANSFSTYDIYYGANNCTGTEYFHRLSTACSATGTGACYYFTATKNFAASKKSLKAGAACVDLTDGQFNYLNPVVVNGQKQTTPTACTWGTYLGSGGGGGVTQP